jgi:hypothetical protein
MDSKHNYSKHNDSEHDDSEHDDSEHNDSEHNDSEHNDSEHNDSEHDDIKNMPITQVQRATGMSRNSPVTFHPPPILRRSYWATCLTCAGRISTVKRYRRLAVCYLCKASSKQESSDAQGLLDCAEGGTVRASNSHG